MNINIGEIVNNKIKEMEENKVVETLIAETIEKSVTKAVIDAIDGYKLKRAIEDKVEKEACDIVNKIGFTAYNTFITDTIKNIMEGTVRKDLGDKIQNSISSILLDKKEGLKISDLFEIYREELNDELEEHEKYELENFTVEVETRNSWRTYKLSKEKPMYSHSNYDIEFVVFEKYKDDSKGTIWRVKINGEEINNSLKIKHTSGIENILINLMYNKTEIIIDIDDEDDIDTSLDWEC